MAGIRQRLTYANVVATIALFLALTTGGVYAASKIKLKNNSVSTPKIRNGAVTGPKLAAGAVANDKLAGGAINSGSIADGSLQRADTSPAAGVCAVWWNTTLRATPPCSNPPIGAVINQDTPGHPIGWILGDGVGEFCLALPFQPTGGAVSVEATGYGPAKAFMTLRPTEITAVGCPATTAAAGGSKPVNAAVTTFTPLDAPANIGWYGIFY